MASSWERVLGVCAKTRGNSSVVQRRVLLACLGVRCPRAQVALVCAFRKLPVSQFKPPRGMLFLALDV